MKVHISFDSLGFVRQVADGHPYGMISFHVERFRRAVRYEVATRRDLYILA